MDSLGFALDLLYNRVETAVVSRYQTFDGGRALSRGYLAELWPDEVDVLQNGAEFLY